jgi:hypothetical protein
MRDRLRSPPRKTMEKRRGKLNGHMLRGLYMDFNHQKVLVFSMRRAVTENCPRLLSKRREELKLQGKQPCLPFPSEITNICIIIIITIYTKINSVPSMLFTGFVSFTHSRDMLNLW